MTANKNTEKARRAMLAKIHIAKKELGLDDELYRVILEDEFGVKSAAYLSVKEMERLVQRFITKGWKGKSRQDRPATMTAGKQDRQESKGKNTEQQVEKLKERIGQELVGSELTEQRMRGLVRKICGVDDLKWCGDARRLKQLLAVISRIIDEGQDASRG